MATTQLRGRGGDPLTGDFSQARAGTSSASWPVLQWHGGLAALAGQEPSVRVSGGFFIEDDRVLDLGLEPARPVPGFERVTLQLGGRPIGGWGAPALHLAFLFTDFCWEEREGGRLRYAPAEYERRKQQAPGSERELRGRTRALVGVQELMAEGVVEPLILSVRGSYSAALNGILRHANRLADEATRLRRQAGHQGAVPREAFWIPIHAGAIEAVGEGSNTSRVSLPKTSLPYDLDRALLIRQLVDEMHRRPDGTFDQWATRYEEAWHSKMAIDDPDPVPGEEEPVHLAF